MKDIIVAIIIIAIILCAVIYIIKAKKAGVKCIGCAMSKTCSGNCHSDEDKEEVEHSCAGNCSSCTSCNHSHK